MSNSTEDIYAHWGETKESMREKAIDLFSRLLKEARDARSFPQDGSKGQAEAYHQTLLKSLEPDDFLPSYPHPFFTEVE